MISVADSFYFESHSFEGRDQPFSLVALNFDPSILDRASGAALLLERGGKFLEARFVDLSFPGQLGLRRSSELLY